ncbi:hypothetical protein [Halobacteriovorax sp.]|uniref:hypothetical protein n=1 Tax=Halobacteriovorax sp. TaxID=2020862 RepID=UPI0035626C02
MKFLVFGASGLVGTSLIDQLSKEHQVTIALRDVSKISSDKFIKRSINFEEFGTFELENYDGVYCCLGTTIKKAGSKEAFKKVDLDYVLMCYKYALSTNAKFFCVISALGADAKSRVFYSKVKGQMESSLTGPIDTVIVRPSLLLGHREEFRPAEQISSALLSPFSKILPKLIGKYAPIKVEDVAKSMIDLTLKRSTLIKIEYLIK